MRLVSEIPSIRGTSLLISAVVMLLNSACTTAERGDDSSSWVATYDTIGDTLVVRTVSGSIWRDTADLVPEVSIGVFDGPEEYIFGRLNSLALGPDGTIYAMDVHVPALRVYNPDGSYRDTYGRSGQGPGEYQQPDGGLNVLSDGRVVLRDPSNGRIQVFSSEGDPLATWRIRGGFYTSERMIVDREDRSYVQVLLDPDASVSDWRSGLQQILPDGSEGEVLEVPDLGWEEASIEASATNDAGEVSGMMVNSVPFSPDEHAILSPFGYFIHGISTDYTFTLLRTESPPLRIEKEYVPVPVASGERAEEEASNIRNMQNMDPNWRWNGPAIPNEKPAYDGFHAGEDGTIWVVVNQAGVHEEDLDYDPTDPDDIPNEWTEPTLFDVFDAEGRYLGAVRTPEGFSTHPTPIFNRDWILATARDELDIQSIVKYRVVLPGGRFPASIAREAEAGENQ